MAIDGPDILDRNTVSDPGFDSDRSPDPLFRYYGHGRNVGHSLRQAFPGGDPNQRVPGPGTGERARSAGYTDQGDTLGGSRSKRATIQHSEPGARKP